MSNMTYFAEGRHLEMDAVLKKAPGSPWVTSNGPNDAIVWILVANVTRGASLVGPNVPHPILCALDPVTLKALWISAPAMLNAGGKYNAPAFGRGMVFVGTDRIQAFGVGRGLRPAGNRSREPAKPQGNLRF